MKKLFATTVLALTLAVSTFATDVNNVSSNAMKNFSYEFAEAKNINWKSVDDYFKASFTLNNVSMVAFYDRQGNYVGSSNKIDVADLPITAKRSLAKKYSDYAVTEAIKFSATEEDVYYIAAANETHNLILKVSAKGLVSVFKLTKK